jgi:hypothetical protein
MASKKVVEVQVEAEVNIWVHLEPEEDERLKISLSEEIQPREAGAHVTLEDGELVVGSVVVKGRLYRKDRTLGERWREVLYTGPLDEEFEGPEWLAPLLKEEIAKRFGGGVRLTDQQVYDLSTRTNSNLGLENFRKVAEDVLGSKPAVAPEQPKERSPQRRSFDTALNVLLLRENLDGAEWAIQQILDEAKGLEGGPGLGDSAVAEYLRTLAEKISGGLDKRTAELAAENWG